MSNSGVNRPEVIPFGKYKGQPAEVLMNDPKYVEWLNGQGWVKEKYPQFYTVIINNFQEPSDTPEHNAIQVMFLDNGFCQRLIALILNLSNDGLWVKDIKPPMFEINAVDIRLEFNLFSRKEFEFQKCHYNEKIKTLDKRVSKLQEEYESRPNPNHEGRWLKDVKDELNRCIRRYPTQQISESLERKICSVEVKPSLGDDFPSVLRQSMRMEGNYRCTVFRDFVATSVTLDQVRAMFKHSGVILLSLAEIEQAEIDTRFDDWYKANIENA